MTATLLLCGRSLAAHEVSSYTAHAQQAARVVKSDWSYSTELRTYVRTYATYVARARSLVF